MTNVIKFPLPKPVDSRPKYYTKLYLLEDGSLWASCYDKLNSVWGDWYKLKETVKR